MVRLAACAINESTLGVDSAFGCDWGGVLLVATGTLAGDGEELDTLV